MIIEKLYSSLEEQFLAESDTPKSKDNFPIWTWEISNCLRKAMLKRLKYPEQQKEPRFYLLQDEAKIWKKCAIMTMQIGGIAIDDNVDKVVSDNGKIAARIDAVFTCDKKAFLLEIESLNTYGFARLEKNGIKKEMPEKYLEIQGKLAIAERPLKIVAACYIARDRNTGKLYEEIVKPDTGARMDFFHRATIFEDCLKLFKTPVIPKAEYDPITTKKKRNGETVIADWHCEYCTLREACINVPGGL